MAYYQNFGPVSSLRSQEDVAAQDILAILCRNNGSMTLTVLTGKCKSMGNIQLSKSKLRQVISDIVNKYEGQLFTVESRGREQVVSPFTNLQLCTNHCTHSGCDNPSMCGGLHLCKSYGLGTPCRFQQNGRNNCRFGHNHRDHHNLSLLHAHNLEKLTEDELKCLLQQNRSKATLPRICKFYNVEKGCRSGQEGHSCSALHVCKFYVQGNCGFGPKCKRSHDIFDPQPKQLLIKHGINVQRSPKQVLEELQEAMGEGSEVSSEKSFSSQPERRRRTRSRSRTPSRGKRDFPLSVVQFEDEDIDDMKSSVDRMRIRGDSTGDPLDDTDEICTFFLRGQCNYGQSCKKHHRNLPYQWQYEDAGWVDFEAACSEEIELNFSEASNTDCFTTCTDKRGGRKVIQIDFNTMKVQIDKQSCKVRRLSTLSYVKAAPSHIFTTKWLWYWQDEHGQWKKYGDKVVGPKDVICSVQNRNIEESYLENNLGSLDFSTSNHKYQLMFDRMKQKNMHFGTERDVVRRPEFVGRKTAKDLKENKRSTVSENNTRKEVLANDSTPMFETAIPSHWKSSNPSDGEEYQLVEIERTGDTLEEYFRVEKLFHETMSRSSYPIKKILRVQNMELWDKYSRNKIWRYKKASKEQEEKLLFHGTRKEHIPAICQQGFDWRIAGSSVGTKFGKGSYFAKTADYSRNYTDCNQLFVVRVLVGQFTTGNPKYVKPPPKDPSIPKGPLFDSCVDNLVNPKMFIVFEQERSYPEYLIEYNSPGCSLA